MKFRKKKSTQKSIFIRKHMITVKIHYNEKVKIIEHEVDIQLHILLDFTA